MTTLTSESIALNKLVLWSGNVRKTGAGTALDELTASIAAHGLLNPLTVRKAPKGKYAVVAGQRRLKALQALAQAGTLTKAEPIACHVVGVDADAAELSLAENVVRAAMHPADQFEAWRGLVEQGRTVPEIAARFGVAESTVRKRLALASVSPVIFALYRDGAMSLEALQAFTLNDDHAMQESVWQVLPEWQKDNPSLIRRALTETDIPCTDRRVIFVGFDAYEAAGGAVRRDLFNPTDGGFVQDAALLDRLAMAKLDEAAAEVKTEGWLWTEVRLSFNWEDRRDFDDIDALRCVWTDEIKAKAGAIVSLGYDGSIEIERGLVRADDVGAESEADEVRAPASSESEVPSLPASLIEDLTAQKTAALRAELSQSPAMALALVTHAMALSAFYHMPHGILKAGLTVRSLRSSIRNHAGCKAVSALEAERTRILDRLPGNADDLLAWCLTALQDDLLDVLAVAAAHGLDAVVSKSDPNRVGVAMGQRVAEAMQLDMAQWYRPTAEGYFVRVSKAIILADLAEARGKPCAPSWEKMKKVELAVLAEREVAATAWLPVF